MSLIDDLPLAFIDPFVLSQAVRLTDPDHPMIGALVVDDTIIPVGDTLPRFGKIVDVREFDKFSTTRDRVVKVQWLDGTWAFKRISNLKAFHVFIHELDRKLSKTMEAFPKLQAIPNE